MKVLEIKNISKYFNKKVVLNNFSLTVNEGEIISIVGPSGIGKSTLLRCICGIEKVDEGEIIINENRVNKKMSKLINVSIGMVFQDYNLFPQYSIIKNIILPLSKVLKISKKEAEMRAKELLIQMNLLEKVNAYPYQLSGGEKQRLAIARTLALNPKIICFDEPTSALDPELVKQIYKIIKKLSNIGTAILIVTHDMKFANDISDRIIKIKKA